MAVVHPGTTRNNAWVEIDPLPAYRFGEGRIKRYIVGIKHATATAADMKPVSKNQ